MPKKSLLPASGMIGLKSANAQKTFLILLFGWAVLNLIQAGFTELSPDEAYYYVYSRYLDWGYFDHPPFLALMIRAGTELLPGEIGVRMMSVLFTSGTLFILWKLLPESVTVHKNSPFLFFGVISSALLFHPIGFIATPDVPLLFFSALFLYVYRLFLLKSSLKRGLLLGIVMALMLYGKYHGILVIGFTVLSNIRLLFRKQFIVACLVGVLFFLPHLYWQYTHDFPSVKYHLYDRSAYPYDITYTLEYLIGLLLTAGPFTFFAFYWALFTFRPKNLFDRALTVTTIGIFGFFLLSSLKGRVEAHWTATAFLSLTVIACRQLSGRPKLSHVFLKLAGVTFFLILIIRVVLMLDFLPFGLKIRNEFQGNKKFAADVEYKAGNLPVVFTNSYQQASIYRFYTGKAAYSLNNIWYRKNQYDLWNFEERLQGKKVLLVTNYNAEGFKKAVLGNVERYLKIIPEFRSFANVKIEVLTNISTKSFHISDSVCLKLRMHNPYSYTIHFKEPNHKTELVYSYFKKDKFYNNAGLSLPIDSISANSVVDFGVTIGLPNTPDDYSLTFSLQTDALQPGLNGPRLKADVSE